MYLYDASYILVLIGLALTMLASFNVKNTFSKYSKVRSYSGMTGAEAADRILRSEGIMDVRIQHIAGNLTDHYDPSSKILRLSDSVYGSTSIAAIGVAAHECGHAVQHARSYAPLTVRSALVPVANFGSKASWPLFMVGLMLGGNISYYLLELGILLFVGALLFQIVTLPVEFNASSRALRILENQGILGDQELSLTRKVLTAAALTYVASVAASLLQLLRLIMIANRRRR